MVAEDGCGEGGCAVILGAWGVGRQGKVEWRACMHKDY